MVKNARGGNRAKKMGSKRTIRNNLPEEDELARNSDMYAIAQVTDICNTRHFIVTTMDEKRLTVYCSTLNKVGRVNKADYVLIFKPNTEYHFKRSSSRTQCQEKLKSVIIALLTQDNLDVLTTRHKFAFIEEHGATNDEFIKFESVDETIDIEQI